MRTNGTLTYAIYNGTYALDDNGEAIDTQVTWSEPLPCSIKSVTDDRVGRYEDGEFRQASYEIMIEMQPFPYNRVRLERLGEDLGEHRVISAEPLVTVGRTLIKV